MSLNLRERLFYLSSILSYQRCENCKFFKSKKRSIDGKCSKLNISVECFKYCVYFKVLSWEDFIRKGLKILFPW